jgi:hypothetical protein
MWDEYHTVLKRIPEALSGEKRLPLIVITVVVLV